MTADALSPGSAMDLRAGLVDRLRESGSIRSAAVAAAFSKVPREKFAPESPLTTAYAWRDAVVTRRDDSGRATSSVSAPWLQAEMIEAAGIARGARVLEIGSGGYNAALLAEMTGPDGSVVTVDIDPWVTERAARFLAETGYANVEVLLGDAEHAADGYGPFDAIVVTAEAWDCPWARLLVEGGTMVVPLVFATNTRSITFVRDCEVYRGLNPEVCGFVGIQGAGAHQNNEATLAGGAVRLMVEDGPDLDPAALEAALTGPGAEAWTGVLTGSGEAYDTLHLWLATADEQAGTIWQEPDATFVQPAAQWSTPALISPDSFAYLTTCPAGEPDGAGGRRFEFGVRAHGPGRDELARQMTHQVQVWDGEHRHGPGPAFTLYPAEVLVPVPRTGRVFRKRHTQLVMAWPETSCTVASS